MSAIPDFTHRSVLNANRRSVLKGTLWLFVIDMVVFGLPYIIKLVIDRLSGAAAPSWMPVAWQQLNPTIFLICLCAFYLGLSGFIAYGRYWWRVHLIWSTFHWFHLIRKKLFGHIQGLDRDFFKTHKVGDLLSALTTDTENIRMTLAIGSLMVIDVAINFLLFPVLLWILDPTLTLMIVPALMVASFVALIASDKLSNEYARVQDITADLSGRAFEMMSGVRVIKAFRKEKPVHDEFVNESKKLRDASLRVARFQSLFVPGLDYCLALALVVVLLYGGHRVLNGTLSLSSFVAFQLYLAHLDWPMMAMGWFIQMYRLSQASQGRVQAIAKFQSSLQVVSSEHQESSDAPLFELRKVSYRFSERRQSILRDVNLCIPRGKWIGLTGPVGSGKTTFLELLSRQRDPVSGEIFFHGKPLRSFAPDQLAQRVLYVPQEAFMFSKSIRKNLTFGLDQSVPNESLWRLLQDLSFDSKMLEERGGLDVQLGERGVNLSGGQKQRLSLGRALLRHRDVYLLDDLFSHVDAETEAKLLSTLKRRLGPPVSVIMVSQRLATLSQCDEVIVLSGKPQSETVEFQGPIAEATQKSPFLDRLHFLQSVETHEMQKETAS